MARIHMDGRLENFGHCKCFSFREFNLYLPDMTELQILRWMVFGVNIVFFFFLVLSYDLQNNLICVPGSKNFSKKWSYRLSLPASKINLNLGVSLEFQTLPALSVSWFKLRLVSYRLQHILSFWQKRVYSQQSSPQWSHTNCGLFTLQKA
jgi:hypothetical protein